MPISESAVTKAVLAEVEAERAKQDEKWGEQNHPNGSGKELFKEYAEVAKRLCDAAAKKGTLTWAKILEEEFWEALAEGDAKKLRVELVQVAAVAIGWVEAIDRAEAKAKV